VWREALGIVKKDLLYLFRERQQIIMFILLPIIILFLFVLVFGGMGGDGGFVPGVTVVDLDGGDYSSRIIANMTGDPTINVAYFNETVNNLTAAEGYLDSGEIDAIVVFPSGFSESLESFICATVNVTVDATEPTLGMTTDRVIGSFFAVETTYLQQEAATMMAQFGGENIPSTGFMSEPVTLEMTGVTHEVYNVNAALLTQAMSFAIIWVGVMAGASGLAYERQNRTFARIVTSPAPAVAVYIGKLFAYTIELLICTVVMVIIGMVVLGIQISADPLTVFVVLVLAVLPAIALGMIFSSLAKKPMTGATLAWVFAMPAGFIGGAFVPTELLPESTAPIQAIFPFATAQNALADTFVRGYDLSQLLDSVGYLALLAAIYLALGLFVYIVMQRRGRLA